MKYKGEGYNCNNGIECNLQELMNPYLNEWEGYIKKNNFEDNMKLIKKGIPIGIIDKLYIGYDMYIKQNSLASLFTYEQIGTDGRIVNHNRGRNLYIFEILCMSNYNILEYMKKYQKIDISNIKELLNNSYLLNHIDFTNKDYTIMILTYGFEKFFDNDVISAIHILIPQIEYLLRNICKINDIEQHIKFTKYKCEDFYQLGKLIEIIRNSDIYFPKYFLDFIERFLLNSNADGGLNYRNDICHGVPVNYNNKLLSTIIIIILYLIN